jgi:Fe-S-cluster containining protein
MQRTCCQRAEVLVTAGDVERIRAASGSEDFFEYRRAEDESYLEFDSKDPDWLTLTVEADGTRRMLRRTHEGDCVFLGTGGCRLTLEVRPLVCRLYPLNYVESGFVGAAEEYCPVSVLSPDGRSMAEVLEVDPAEARRWHAALYQELRRGPA